MTRIIVVANQKGGVAKTTTVLNLGRALTEKGHKVLMIDLDPQAGLTASTGVDPYQLEKSTYSLLMRPEAKISDLAIMVGENWYIVPATSNLTAAEIRLAQHPQSTLLLSQQLKRDALNADFVLIDTPPTLNILAINGYIAAQEVLIPVQCTYLAMRGVRETLNTVEQLSKRINPNLKVLGYLATMFDETNAPVSKEVVDELRAVFGTQVFQTVIGRASVLAESPIDGMSILDYDTDHPAAFAYRALAQEVINRGKPS